MSTKKYTRRGEKKGYRSSFESQVIELLNSSGVEFEYEPIKIEFYYKPSEYTPDLRLKNGILIELKGYFDAFDRQKHLLIKQQHPNLDIRFVFMRSSNKLNKNSPTTYGDWCDKHGFKWASKTIPLSWILES